MSSFSVKLHNIGIMSRLSRLDVEQGDGALHKHLFQVALGGLQKDSTL